MAKHTGMEGIPRIFKTPLWTDRVFWIGVACALFWVVVLYWLFW